MNGIQGMINTFVTLTPFNALTWASELSKSYLRNKAEQAFISSFPTERGGGMFSESSLVYMCVGLLKIKASMKKAR